ncbi:MAG TPA: S8 family serine peptidase, partial [Streptosporangiaceae bacterium]|nr:S8 family serine peptidase [Streptosporangiaceae bacterium]
MAIVDAYRDPDAATDLASYRSFFHLGACTTASGCLRIVNQNGRSKSLPGPRADWAVEQSLDLDMVSAICPHCHLLLVEARSSSSASLGRAEDTAVRLGARFVSNSWSSNEEKGQSALNHYFNHPGDAIVVASGDSGYGTSYPADLQFVTSVGGTDLTHRKSGTRGWTETAWGSASKGAEGTGSGCSSRTAKPSWQRAAVDVAAGGCTDRTENDVSAVADPATGVAVYDTYRTRGTWALVGGTSAATPIIAATYALA